MKKASWNWALLLAGALSIGAGLGLLRWGGAGIQGGLAALPYVLVGLGCGALGHGLGEVIGRRAMAGDPEAALRLQIERGDERNIALAHAAKAKAYDLMTYVFGALMICFALMGVEVTSVLLLVAAYLFVQGYGVYWRMRYDRER